MSEQPLLSVVIPALNEAENIPDVIGRTRRMLDALGLPWELILVDDGSQDNTYALMSRAADNDPRVRAVRLSRNFGSHLAITAGLHLARGDACLVITADLEEPPEMIATFLDRWREGFEVVWGVRAKRIEALPTRVLSEAFHALFRLLGLPEYSRQAIGGGFFLADRKVVAALRQIRERNRTIVGLLFWMGFRHGYVQYSPRHRHSGRSKWTLAKRVKLAIDSFVSFSYVPILLVSALGIMISALSFLYGLAIVLHSLLAGVSVQGWPTMMVTLLFLSGVQLVVTGMMGEYIWRAVDEARGRPLYIICETAGFSAEDASTANIAPRPEVASAGEGNRS